MTRVDKQYGKGLDPVGEQSFVQLLGDPRLPPARAHHGHVRAFAEILTARSGQHLKGWITATRADDLPGLHTFATGLERRTGTRSFRA
ncbi:hypothetical protein ACK8N7_00640 [Streptomyces griseobrunneus]|uniref:hypothetical protein n=1 Tax=Streptomyces microflavus TaxID=1919 RepID=UPI00381571B5